MSQMAASSIAPQTGPDVATDAPAPIETEVVELHDETDEILKEVLPGYVRFSIFAIFLMMAAGVLYFAKDVFMPVVFAFVLALTLTPVVRFFEKKRVPPAATAILLALSIAIGAGWGVSALVQPITDLIESAPQIKDQVEEKLRTIREPVEAVMEAQEELGNVAGAPENGDEQEVRQVTVQGPGILTTAAGSVVSGLTTFVVIFVLVIFLLASGDMFYEKLVRSFDKMSDRKRALRTAYDIQREVSRYLFTITLINAGLGVAVGTVLYFLGMPQAYVWGAIAFVANFIPYIGAVFGMAAVGVVALVTFDTIGAALLVPLAYFACTFLEGQFITPLIVGRRLQINAVVIFISVAFWAWMWGLVGAILAVPLLVIAKTLASHYPSLNTFADFLSDDGDRDPDVETGTPNAKPERHGLGPVVAKS